MKKTSTKMLFWIICININAMIHYSSVPSKKIMTTLWKRNWPQLNKEEHLVRMALVHTFVQLLSLQYGNLQQHTFIHPDKVDG